MYHNKKPNGNQEEPQMKNLLRVIAISIFATFASHANAGVCETPQHIEHAYTTVKNSSVGAAAGAAYGTVAAMTMTATHKLKTHAGAYLLSGAGASWNPANWAGLTALTVYRKATAKIALTGSVIAGGATMAYNGVMWAADCNSVEHVILDKQGKIILGSPHSK